MLRNLKEQYPSLTFAFVNDAICVRMSRFWTTVASKENGAWVNKDHTSKVLPNYVIFKELEASLLRMPPTAVLTFWLMTKPQGPCTKHMTALGVGALTIMHTLDAK